MEYSIQNMRLPRDQPVFWESQIKEFAKLQDNKKYSAVEIGRQDIRGGFSICWYGINDYEHCIVAQQFFMNRWELLGFIKGQVK